MNAPPDVEVVRVVPPGGESYAYRLPVPRGWSYGGSVGKAIDLDTIARPIGTFVPRDRSASIVVSVMPLPIEVRLEEWVADDLGRARWQVDVMAWHRIGGAPKLAVVARRDTQVRAIAVVPDGGRLYAVNVLAPLARTPEVVDRLWSSAMKFRSSRPGGLGRLEARQPIALDRHCFEAPVSWEARPPRITANEARVQLVLRHPAGIERGRLVARIDRSTTPATSIALRRAATVADLARRGLVLGRTLEPPKEPWRGVPEGWELRSVAARNRSGAVVDLLLVHGNHHEACVEIIAIGSRGTPRSWMRTTRALEIACETFQRIGR